NPAFNNSGLLEVRAGTLSFGGGFTQTAGETVLNDPASNGGAIASSSALAIQGGRLSGHGTITGVVNNTGGTVGPGYSQLDLPGTLTITGNYTQGPAGAFAVKIRGLSPGVDIDEVNVGGSATLDGTLAVS